MNKIFYLVLLSFSFLLTTSACKKKTEAVQQDLILEAMVNGKWKMSWFKENNVGIPDFDGYEFQYYRDYTVDATKDNTTKRGNWSGSAAAMTTSADFPAAVGNPLLKINGTWRILRNSWTYVEAEQIIGALVKTMRLDKK
jgi:hypothetical protein